MPTLPYILAAAVVILATTILRLLYVLPAFNPTKPLPRLRGSPTRLLVVLGSGGHTSEMFSLLHDLDPNIYTHRSYVVSSGDEFSASKAVEFETAIQSKRRWCRFKQEATPVPSTYDISVIPRAHSDQNQMSKVAANAPHYTYPDLIVANGPATAVLVMTASLVLRFFGLRGIERKMRTIYVESWARVNSLSLSGKVLVTCGMVNRMLVQWENLSRKGQGEFIGALVQ
ncbi:MAG: hypothetical protein Q9166_002161 [cf. Caloplaca sp. 2 TL-2023]